MSGNTEQEQLKPCPFCGVIPDLEKWALQSNESGEWCWIDCCGRGPEIRTGYQDRSVWKDRSIEAWNTRTTEPIRADSGLVKRIEQQIEKRWHELHDKAEKLREEQRFSRADEIDRDATLIFIEFKRAVALAEQTEEQK